MSTQNSFRIFRNEKQLQSSTNKPSTKENYQALQSTKASLRPDFFLMDTTNGRIFFKMEEKKSSNLMKMAEDEIVSKSFDLHSCQYGNARYTIAFCTAGKKINMFLLDNKSTPKRLHSICSIEALNVAQIFQIIINSLFATIYCFKMAETFEPTEEFKKSFKPNYRLVPFNNTSKLSKYI